MRKILIFCLLTVCIPTSAHAQNDCENYIAALRSDIANVDAEASGTNWGDPNQVAGLYMRTFKMRWLYEDMEDIPDCAALIHPFAIQYFAALEDALGLSLAWFAYPPNQAGYEQEVIPALGRIDRMRGQLQVLYNDLDEIDTSQPLFPSDSLIPTPESTEEPDDTPTPEMTEEPIPETTPEFTDDDKGSGDDDDD
jgi:hypothetical protein